MTAAQELLAKASRLPPEPLRREIAARSFQDFLQYVKVLDPPPAGKGVVLFELWPHLLEATRALEEHQLIVWLKARQIGISWLLAAYALWTALFKPAANVVLISRGELEAIDLLGKCRFAWAQLPEWLRLPLTLDNRSELVWDSMRSRIVALPSTPGAGRSTTATLVIIDEADYHAHLADNYAAVKPTIDTSRGQLVLVSTSNPASTDSTFKSLWRGAPANGYHPLFFHWRTRPGRDDAWYEERRREAPDQALFEKEYPNSPQEALAPAQATAFFSREALGAMLLDCRAPVEVRRGLVSVWRKPVVAARYVAFLDPCWGEKGSFACMVLMDWQTGEQMAELHGRPGRDEMAQAAYDICKEYNQAWFGGEANGEGRYVVEKMVELGYGPRMYWRDADQPQPKKPGWLTDGTTRPIMLAELDEAVRNMRVRPRCKDAVGEMMSFIRNERGRPEAAQGAYSDHVMAWAGAWQMRKSVRFGVSSAKPLIMPKMW